MKKFLPVADDDFSSDPFVPDAVMPIGPFAGKAIDASERRPLSVITGKAAAPFTPAQGDIIAANFRHDGKFWIVKFRPDAVQRVIFEKWDFGEKRVRLRLFGKTRVDFALFHVAHTELRFKFREGQGAVLYAQRRFAPGERAEPATGPVEDVVNSIEAVSVPGVTFGIRGGLGDYFVASRRFKSLQENYYERVVRERCRVQQWDLLLDDARKRKMFERAVLDSDADGLDTPYHLFRHSCTTESFRMIDAVMNYGIRTWRTFFRRVPHFPEVYLWARGLLKPGGKSRMPHLGEEKAEWREELRERFRRERKRT